jgi:seryl-tRNA synthetase
LSPNRAKIIKAILTNNTLSEDKKSEIIAEIMDEFQKTYPDLQYHATKADVKESELKLTKEIENIKLEIEEVRKEIKDIELKVTKEIENVKFEIEEVRKETKEIEAKLSKEIKELDMKLSKEIKEVELKLTKEIENAKFIMLKWQFVFWISQMAAIIAIFYKLIH